MATSNQENSARRFPSFDIQNPTNAGSRFDAYDCELPPGVRAELGQPPRRPRILSRPAATQVSKRPRYLLLLIAAVVVAGTVIAWWVSRKPAAPAPDLVLQHSRAIVEAQTTAPVWHSDGPAYGRAGIIGQPTLTTAPRAELVKLPPPHAQLVQLPAPRAELAMPGGEQYPVLMPYGLDVSATFRGELASEDMLPSSGNAIGDSFAIGDHVWIWVATPGTSAAQWVDP